MTLTPASPTTAATTDPSAVAELGRRTQEHLELVHAVIFSAPETEAELGALGLDDHATRYFAQRAAPLGAAGPRLVSATFLGFSPALIARAVPHAWSRARPQEVVAARLRAADTTLRRLLGHHATSRETSEAAELARRAARGAPPELRPMFAAHADAPWPGEADDPADSAPPHLVLWHAATLLREYRCDAHMVALGAAGLTGLEAVITFTATGRGFLPEPARTTRGWSTEEWDAARTRLDRRGLLDTDGALTAAGEALRADVEDTTSHMAAGPWMALGAADTERLRELVDPISATLVAAGGFPEATFAAHSPKAGRDG